MTLAFRDIDLEQHGALCTKIRAETFAVSFDTDALFWAEAGPQGEFYLAALKERMEYLPGSCVHAWIGDDIVGMLELKPSARDSGVGYVNTFYLLPAFRGQGLTDALEDYIKDYFTGQGMTTVSLTVSPDNRRAVAYYRKHGWKDMGSIPMMGGWLPNYNAGILPGGQSPPPLPSALDAKTAQLEQVGGAGYVLLMEKRYDH